MINETEKRFFPVPTVQTTVEKQEKSNNTNARQSKRQNSLSSLYLQIRALFKIVVVDYRKSIEQSVEYVVIELRNSVTSVVSLFSGKDFLDPRCFNQKISESIACFEPLVDEKKFLTYKRTLLENLPVKKIYACGGNQNKSRVYKNALFSFDTNEILPAQKFNTYKDYDCIENTLISLDNSIRPELSLSMKSPTTVISDFFENLAISLHNPCAYACIGGILATPFMDILKSINQGFPPVFFFGAPQSGKSAILQCIVSIFGLPDSSVIAGTSTNNAILKRLGSSFCSIVPIEELNSKFITEPDDIVKALYDCNSRSRGTKEGTKEQPILSTLLGTSNDFFTNPNEQVLSRILFCNFEKKDFCSSNFIYFEESKRKELSIILPALLYFRNDFINIFQNTVQIVKSLVPNSYGSRHLRNIAISCSMWQIINHILRYEYVNWYNLAVDYCAKYDEILISQTSKPDLMLRHISKLIYEQKLTYGVDYCLVHDVILRLNVRKFVGSYNNIYGIDEKQMLNERSFCQIVQNDGRFDCNRKTMKNIGRAISINISDEEYLLFKVREIKCGQAYGGKYEDED